MRTRTQLLPPMWSYFCRPASHSPTFCQGATHFRPEPVTSPVGLPKLVTMPTERMGTEWALEATPTTSVRARKPSAARAAIRLSDRAGATRATTALTARATAKTIAMVKPTGMGCGPSGGLCGSST
ncbi:hypothetical protein JNW90_06480 [Micromonospora sp. STR1s_5]|nr:hypothetical protein [Micromonospora sp. STR1s_5]